MLFQNTHKTFWVLRFRFFTPLGRLSNHFTFCVGLQFGLRLELTLALFGNNVVGELMREEVIGG